MERTLVDNIKTHDNRKEVELLLKEAVVAIQDEIKTLLDVLDDTDVEFIIELYEDHIYILNDQLREIIRYLKKKHGEIKNESLNQSTLLINNIDNSLE